MEGSNIPANIGVSAGDRITVHGDMNTFVNCDCGPSTSAQTKGKSLIRSNMPLPTLLYQGRKKISGEILVHFNGASADCFSRIVAITGMGGIGKSETACKFAMEHRNIFPFAAWINAETEQSALDSFLRLAKKLEMVSKDRQQADLQLVEEIYDHIDAKYQDKVLLIFDNAIKLNAPKNEFGIFEYLPTKELDNQRFPYVIITSQTSDWQQGITTFELKMLEVEESVLFFRSTFKIPSSAEECDEDFRKLHSHLKGYPLAMTLAASNIDFKFGKHDFNWLKKEVEEYIKKFQSEDSRILTQNINPNWPSKYRQTLSTVWQLTFKRLTAEPNGANALILLQAVSFFHVPLTQDDLRWVFIECPYCPGTPGWIKNKRLRASIRLLERFHLLDCVFTDLDHSNELEALETKGQISAEDLAIVTKEVKRANTFKCELRIHRLVQLVVRLDMDCTVVLEDILRFLAFRSREAYVRQLNVTAVEEAFGRTQLDQNQNLFGRTKLSTRGLAFLGLHALQGNPAAQRFVRNQTAPTEDLADTIWRVLQLDKSVGTQKEEAVQLLRALIRRCTSEQSLIDKRCFAFMAFKMLNKVHAIFLDVRYNGASELLVRNFMEIQPIAKQVFSIGSSFTDVCFRPIQCLNQSRAGAEVLTVLAGGRMLEDLTAITRILKQPESRIEPIRAQFTAYRERVEGGNNRWPQYNEEMNKIHKSGTARGRIESDVRACGGDQLKLKQVFRSIFAEIWSATGNKNFTGEDRLEHAFREIDLFIHRFLKIGRLREIVIPLVESFITILQKTEKVRLAVFKDPEECFYNAAIWICSTWMNLCIQEDSGMSSKELSNCLSSGQILNEIKNIPMKGIRDALQFFSYWRILQNRHQNTFDEFMQIYSESSMEQFQALVTICKAIQDEMSVAIKP